MRLLSSAIAVLCVVTGAAAQSATRILFIGNSFTFADGSPVRFYRAETVTDLNGEGIGGMPALFKSFTQQAGLPYEVFVETRPGAGLDFHLANRRDVIRRAPADVVVMHGYSTLDQEKPGDPTKLVATSVEMATFLRELNPAVQIHLMATWARADQTYPATGAWAGRPIAAMARDVRAGYDRAAEQSGARMVIPVGEAWNRAMETGVADPNPYDGIAADQLDLWTHDHYHASTYGYYLEALVVFGSVTGRDPRSLGDGECSAFELGMSRRQARALQQVAFDQLTADGITVSTPETTAPPAGPTRCVPAR